MGKCVNCEYFIVTKGSFNGEFVTETNIECWIDLQTNYQMGYVGEEDPNKENGCPKYKRKVDKNVTL